MDADLDNLDRRVKQIEMDMKQLKVKMNTVEVMVKKIADKLKVEVMR